MRRDLWRRQLLYLKRRYG